MRDIFLCRLSCLPRLRRAAQEPVPSAARAAEAARRLAAEADDRALGLEARQGRTQEVRGGRALFADAARKRRTARALKPRGPSPVVFERAAGRATPVTPTRARASQAGDRRRDGSCVTAEGLAAAHLRLQERRRRKGRSASRSPERARGLHEGTRAALVTLSDLQNYDAPREGAQDGARSPRALVGDGRPRKGSPRRALAAGRCLLAQNALAESAGHYRTALQIWRESNNAAEQAEAIIMLGMVEYRKGEWEASISLLTEAQGLLDERAEPAGMGRIAATLADNFNENGCPKSPSRTSSARRILPPRRGRDTSSTSPRGGSAHALSPAELRGSLAHFRQLLEGVRADSLPAATPTIHRPRADRDGRTRRSPRNSKRPSPSTAGRESFGGGARARSRPRLRAAGQTGGRVGATARLSNPSSTSPTG